MMILSMRATFGKLEHQTLTLKPGLNILEGPNEWGKSTWCAFLITMFYGIDSRSKTTRSQLADKDRYTPWSGAPMEGSMELLWKGRRITLERSTQGRIPMGTFRAYETDTGLDIPELTEENCGQVLLGVEKEVFSRSAFLRFSDLPVTDQEQLRSRLNALVTTGDESGHGERLDQKLKELKNRIRYNRSGLLPQAYLEKQQLEERMGQQQGLSQQEQKLNRRIQELESYLEQLQNHKANLQLQRSQFNQEQLLQAQEACQQAKLQLDELEAMCQDAPSRDTAYHQLQELNRLRRVLDALDLEEAMLPPMPTPPEPPAGFEGCSPQAALAQATEHVREASETHTGKSILAPIFLVVGCALLALTFYLIYMHENRFYLPLIGSILTLAASTIISFIGRNKASRVQSRLLTLRRKYGSDDPQQWLEDAQAYVQAWDQHGQKCKAFDRLRGNLGQRKADTLSDAMTATQSQGLGVSMEHWKGILSLWDSWADARRQWVQASKYVGTLSAETTPVSPKPIQDDMSFTTEETDRLISDTSHELRQLISRLGQCRGQLQTLDSNTVQKLSAMDTRIQKLELTYQALECARSALEEASQQLQRRFAPRIADTTRKLFERLTGGRYDRVQISQDLSLSAAATDEDALRSHHWRSDGTVDQLYLALRLAVADALIPDAPIILDDALVRFDDARLGSALQVLKEQGTHRQVLLFTCQSRERQLLDHTNN